MRSNEKSLKQLCLHFLHFMLFTKKISKHTLRAYKTDLKDLFDLSKELKEDLCTLSYKEFKNNSIIRNQKQLSKTVQKLIEQNTTKHLKLANSSRSRKIATARSFIHWLADNDYIDSDFRHLFKSPKLPPRIPSFLSVDEIFSVIDMFKKEKPTQNTARDRALFFLLYGGGLRVSEACTLQTKNIDFINHIIKVKGKGNQERLIAFPEKAMEYLKKFKTNQAYFFGLKALCPRKAYDIIRSIGQKTALMKPLHPHALRHSFATHMLLGGANLRVLQELLGHKTLVATQKYTHLDLTHLSQTLEKYHPIYQKIKPSFN